MKIFSCENVENFFNSTFEIVLWVVKDCYICKFKHNNEYFMAITENSLEWKKKCY